MRAPGNRDREDSLVNQKNTGGAVAFVDVAVKHHNAANAAPGLRRERAIRASLQGIPIRRISPAESVPASIRPP